jgi:hypothetical protein
MKIENMRYQLDKDLDALRGMAAKVKDSCGDDERAHAAEDKLIIAALEMVAKYAMRPRVKQVAEIGLSTRDLDFARWCA